MSTIPTAKECALHGVTEEIKYFVSLIGIGFHPDNHFQDYINTYTGNRSLPLYKCAALNMRLDECFDMCEKYGLDIYEISLNTVKPIIETLCHSNK